MSDIQVERRIRTTRVRGLGDAVPTFRPFRDDSDDVKVEPKSSDELRQETADRRDAQPMRTSCRVDGCLFVFAGTAGECRVEAAAHRVAAHPELVGARTHRKGISFKRRGEPVDPGTVAESRRLRQERDDKARLDTINRGRAVRGQLLEEAASADGDVGAVAAASSSSPTIGRSTMNEYPCKVDGCDGDATDAPKAGPTAKLCATHRAERSAQLSSRTRVRRTDTPAPGGSLADLVDELEDARADVDRANARYVAAVAAFKEHDTIKRIAEDGVAA